MSGPGKGADRDAWLAARALLEDEDQVDPGALLALCVSKAARKGVAAALREDGVGRAHARVALAGLAGDGVSAELDPERLLRRAAGRSELAQRRKNPIRRNEGFRCTHCDFEVPPAPGGGVRNHCPRCLRSQHVDGAVPGDRAAGCHGIMDPIRSERRAGVLRVLQRCRRCGHERWNGLRLSWSVEPDRMDVLVG